MTALAIVLSQDGLLAFVLMCLVQCSVAIGLALLLSLLLRRNPAARHTVLMIGMICALLCPMFTLVPNWAGWRSVSIRLAAAQVNMGTSSGRNPAADPGHALRRHAPGIAGKVPVVSPPLASLADDTNLGEQPPATARSQLAARLFARLRSPQAPDPLAASPDSDSGPSRSHAFDAQAASQATSVPPALRKLLLVALLVWGAGVVAHCLGISRSWWHLRRLLRHSRLLTDDVLRPFVAQLQADLSLSNIPHVATSAEVTAPISAGVLRPLIVLPTGLSEQLPASELRMILLHEAAHLVRRDPLTVVMEQIFVALLWFHPLAHVVRRQLARCREEVCDNYVLRCVDGPSYGQLLLRLTRILAAPTPAPASLGLLAPRWNLEQRVSGFFDERRTNMVRTKFATRLTAGSAIALAMLTIGATRLETKAQAPEESPAPSTADAEAADPGDLQFYRQTAAAQYESASSDAQRSVRYRTRDSGGARRVAFVNIQRVFKESEHFEKKMVALKQGVKELEQGMKATRQEIERLERVAGVISDEDAKSDLLDLIAAKRAGLQREMNKAREKMMQQESTLYYEQYRVIYEAIEDYAEHHGIELVLKDSADRSSTSFFTSVKPTTIDPTDRHAVLRNLNQEVLYVRNVERKNLDITDAIIERLRPRDPKQSRRR